MPKPVSQPAKAEPETIAPKQPQLSKPPVAKLDDRSPVPVSNETPASSHDNQTRQEYQRLWQQLSQKVKNAHPAYSEREILIKVGIVAMKQWDQTKAIRILAQSPAAQARLAQGDAEFYAYLNKVMAVVSAKRKAAQHHKRDRQMDDGR